MAELSGKDRRELTELIISAYPKPADLELLVDYALEQDLAVIANGEGGYASVVSRVIRWSIGAGKLPDLLDALKEALPGRDIQKFYRRLLTPLVPTSVSKRCLSSTDWDALWGHFESRDYLCFLEAFSRAVLSVRPYCALAEEVNYPTANAAYVREKLQELNEPELAVRFVDFMVARLQEPDSADTRDLSALVTWRDKVAERFDIPPRETEVKLRQSCPIYLLVVVADHADQVTVHPELRIADQTDVTQFNGWSRETCPIAELPTHLSHWIVQAERHLGAKADASNAREVVLELFFADQHLNEDAAEWWMEDEEKDPIQLKDFRLFVVRSLKRIHSSTLQGILTDKWQLLTSCIKTRNAHSKFYREDACCENGSALPRALKDLEVVGLKFLAQLPQDPKTRNTLLKNIRKAPVPIALWSTGMDSPDLEALNTQFDNFLRETCLDNFADVARQLSISRRQSELGKSIRLLCDCPTRLPVTYPDPTQDDDLMAGTGL